jgi:hypothetical protein
LRVRLAEQDEEIRKPIDVFEEEIASYELLD